MMTKHTATLGELRAAADTRREEFLQAIDLLVPGYTDYHWFRAVEAPRSPKGRMNDDTAHDAALRDSKPIREAYKAYLAALHAYYSARDGDRGFLGGKGL